MTPGAEPGPRPESVRQPERTPYSPSPRLKLHIARGVFNADPHPTSPLPDKVSSTTFEAVQAKHNDLRQKDDQRRDILVHQEFQTNPQQAEAIRNALAAQRHVTPSTISEEDITYHAKMIGWSIAERQRLAEIIAATPGGQKKDVLGQALTKLSLGEHGIDVQLCFYDSRPQSIKGGKFYETFCTGNTNQKLADTLTIEEMYALKPFLKDILGDTLRERKAGETPDVAFNALIALKQTQLDLADAASKGKLQQAAANSSPMTQEDNAVLDFYRQGYKLANPNGQDAADNKAQATIEKTDTSKSSPSPTPDADLIARQLPIKDGTTPQQLRDEQARQMGNSYNETDRATLAGCVIPHIYKPLTERQSQRTNIPGETAKAFDAFSAAITAANTERQANGKPPIHASQQDTNSDGFFLTNGVNDLGADHPFQFKVSGVASGNAPLVRAYITVKPESAPTIQDNFVQLTTRLYDAGIKFTGKSTSPQSARARYDDMVFYIDQTQQAQAQQIIATFLQEERIGQGFVPAAHASQYEGLSWAAELTPAQRQLWKEISGSSTNGSYNLYVAALASPTYLKRLAQRMETQGKPNEAQEFKQEAERVRSLIQRSTQQESSHGPEPVRAEKASEKLQELIESTRHGNSPNPEVALRIYKPLREQAIAAIDKGALDSFNAILAKLNAGSITEKELNNLRRLPPAKREEYLRETYAGSLAKADSTVDQDKSGQEIDTNQYLLEINRWKATPAMPGHEYKPAVHRSIIRAFVVDHFPTVDRYAGTWDGTPIAKLAELLLQVNDPSVNRQITLQGISAALRELGIDESASNVLQLFKNAHINKSTDFGDAQYSYLYQNQRSPHQEDVYQGIMDLLHTDDKLHQLEERYGEKLNQASLSDLDIEDTFSDALRSNPQARPEELYQALYRKAASEAAKEVDQSPRYEVGGVSFQSPRDLAASHVTNEDALLIRGTGTIAVFDGAGAHGYGEMASNISRAVVDKALKQYHPTTPESVREALGKGWENTHNEMQIHIQAYPQERGMVSTGTIVHVYNYQGRTHAAIMNAGDSRTYAVHRDGTIHSLTADDNLLQLGMTDPEYMSQKLGVNPPFTTRLTPEDVLFVNNILDTVDGQGDFATAIEDRYGTSPKGVVLKKIWEKRHMMTRSFADNGAVPAVNDITLDDQVSYIFVCSDGVHDNLTATEMQNTIKDASSAQDIATRLAIRARQVFNPNVKYSGREIDMALRKTGRQKPDDVTVGAIAIKPGQ